MVPISLQALRCRLCFSACNHSFRPFYKNSAWRIDMSNRRLILLALAILLTAAVRGTRTVSGDDWQPITPEELKMTSEAKAPGAPAVILYRQIDRDDSNA